ncbi:MAG TPA: hypothetical protein VNH20_05360 [Candidatus Dormibacteraeota bacterium]|nr:hypothetical protein [Candidatus Dormibacteraeota bacterium]
MTGLFLIASVVAVGGIFEGGSHSVDDVGICLLALGGIGWSVPGRHRRSRTLVPLGLVSGALLVQLLPFAIERGNQGDLGDDTLGLLLLAVLLVISGLSYRLAGAGAGARAGARVG